MSPPSASSFKYEYECLKVSISANGIAHVEVNRTKALNAYSTQTWREIGQCFNQFKLDGNVRCVVYSGAGRMFTAGLDLKEASSGPLATNSQESVDRARQGYYHRLFILDFQNALSAIETCDKPVIAVVHNGCIGVGIDVISACDMRVCTEDAYFYVKEVDIGMAADVGLVSNVYADKEKAMEGAFNTAALIASKSPVAVVSTKHLLNYSRDHSVQEGLEYTAIWNALAHNSQDMPLAIMASLQKKQAQFPKL
ncbi:hypothetical protein GGI07_004256 [Coemansia sp. Benny D115]|nr:hypothetical protein GGI07_004256 [Coemansia sp. Benny D115]